MTPYIGNVPREAITQKRVNIPAWRRNATRDEIEEVDALDKERFELRKRLARLTEKRVSMTNALCQRTRAREKRAAYIRSINERIAAE